MAAETAVIVLAAGKGTRTRLPLPKVLLPLCGQSLLEYVMDTVAGLDAKLKVAVLHHGMGEIQQELGPRFEREGWITVDQGEPRGTGHAVERALVALDAKLGHAFVGKVLVLYGDCPLITERSLVPLLGALDGDAHAALLTTEDLEAEGLGRILRDDVGDFVGIREHKDCSPEELLIDEVNTGFCAFRTSALREALPKLGSDNAQGELYLTDVFTTIREEGKGVEVAITPYGEEVMGINTLAHLAEVRRVVQDDLLYRLLEEGVYIEDPSTTVIEKGVSIGRGTRILPHVVIRKGVVVGEDCEIGPFTHLRVGAELEEGAEVGNFVEMKKSVLGKKAKAKHLTYLGDARVGARANIGCGTITANYDGKHKHLTEIGDGAFIGSGTVLVAPCKVGGASMTGAGAVVKRSTEIPADEIWVGVPARRLGPRDPGAGAPDTSSKGKEGEGRT